MTLYEDIIQKLQAPFPQGTVKVEGKRAHIPVQVYLTRLEKVAAEQWSWRIVDEPIIKSEEKIVIIKGEITLVNTVRQGIGVAELKKLDFYSIKNAISTAESEALRNACDKFMMGWRDLAPYREWSSNPGVNLSNNSHHILDFDESVHSLLPPTDQECIRCKKKLTVEEKIFLTNNDIRISYCRKHVPSQFIKNRK